MPRTPDTPIADGSGPPPLAGSPPGLDAARLDAVLEQVPVALVIARSGSGRIVRVNRLASELLDGGPMPECAHEFALDRGIRPDGTAYEPGDWPFARALREGVCLRGERVLFGAGRAERLFEVTSGPVRNAAGEVVSVVFALHEITSEERLQRAEREFVTNAAHELQTPLAAITSAVEVLQAGAKEIPEDRDRFLTHIQAHTHRLARLTHALLVLARLQTGQHELQQATVLLRPLLDETALALDPSPGVEVRVRCPATLAALGDRALLEQALLNVAANAAKYTDTGTILLQARRRGRTVALDVADTGPGIGAEEVGRVFARFSRGEGNEAAGFGLGLAIARDLVSAMDGTVTLERASGGGTLVRIELPAARA